MTPKKSKTLVASAVSLALSSMMLSVSLNAATITGVVRDNLVPIDEQIIVYQDPTTNLITNGFIDPASNIEVYQEVFKSGLDFQGCIMAKLDAVLPALNCKAEQDSSKRIKLNATAVGPIDLVFEYVNSPEPKLYRWYGKLGNQTPGRLTGYKVELVPAESNDGVGFTVLTDSTQTQTIGNFPGGLFGGSPTTSTDGPFFSDLRAEFRPDVAATGEDVIQSTTIPAPYKEIFGNWLPLEWVPTAWFFDDDGNPDTDNLIRAWFDGTKWLDGRGNLISRTDLATWESTPVTVTYTNPATLVTTLFATWYPDLGDDGMYVLASGGTEITSEDMLINYIQGGGGAYARVVGYSMGAVEDLAKINVNYAIDLSETPCATGPSCKLTVRVTPIASTDAAAVPPWFGVTPITSGEQPLPPSTSSGGGGCAIGGDGRFDPTLPALAAAGLVFFGLRRFNSGK